MKKIFLVNLALLSIIYVLPARSEPLIVDHTCVNLYTNLSAADIARVKKMWVSFAGESHSAGIRNGCELLMNLDGRFQVAVQDCGIPEGATSNHLRISRATWGDITWPGWTYSYGEEDWFTSSNALETTKAGLRYCSTNGFQLDVLGFGWCWDMSWLNVEGGGTNKVYGTRWAGASVGGPDGNQRWGLSSADYPLTGNRVCMDTYLNATEQYRSYCASNRYTTKVVFTTGPVDDIGATERGYQTSLKNQYIRNYVQNTADGILFDYADILSWNDSGDQSLVTWRDLNGQLKTFSTIAADNTFDLDASVEDGDHIGQRGALRLAKAMWWLLAKISDEQVESLSITNFVPASTGFLLGWTSSTNHYIVVRSDNLTSGQFECVGAVLATNHAIVTSETAASFYGIREVVVVNVPDLGLRNILSNAILKKYTPPDKLYDIELQPITALQASGACIGNDTGLSWCDSLTNLNISSNQLSSLALEGYSHLVVLDCSHNSLTNLDISSCARLSFLDCSCNNLVDLSSFITNALHGGLGTGDVIFLGGNPLSEMAVTNQIPLLQSLGVTVNW